MKNDKLINKIEKLLARKESSFKAEAEAALIKAQELMIKNGISLDDIPSASTQNQPNVTEERVYHPQAPLWHGTIASILADNFRCKSIWSIEFRNNRRLRVMTFIGLADDAAIVKEAYIYAIALIKYNIRMIKKRFPRVTTKYINTYIKGFAAGLYARFKEQVERENWGLILVTPAPVVLKYESYRPKKVNSKGRKIEYNNNINAFYQGYTDGKAFNCDAKRLNR